MWRLIDKTDGAPAVRLVPHAGGGTDAVVPFEQDTPKELIEAISPNVLVKGEDWADKGVIGREWVESHGGQVVLAPLVPGRSTSAILDRARGAGNDAE